MAKGSKSVHKKSEPISHEGSRLKQQRPAKESQNSQSKISSNILTENQKHAHSIVCSFRNFLGGGVGEGGLITRVVKCGRQCTKLACRHPTNNLG